MGVDIVFEEEDDDEEMEMEMEIEMEEVMEVEKELKVNVEVPAETAQVVKRRRGRPKGSKNRKVSGESPPALGETEGTTERAAKRVYRCKACGECGHSVKTCGRA